MPWCSVGIVINEYFPLLTGIDSSVSIVCVYKGITSRI